MGWIGTQRWIAKVSEKRFFVYRGVGREGQAIVCEQYAVKAQTSLAPLSWFPGSHIPTAHVHNCCRFQSYANSHAIAYEIYKRNLQSVNHIPGIHDNGRPVTFDFNSVFLAPPMLCLLKTFRRLCSFNAIWRDSLQNPINASSFLCEGDKDHHRIVHKMSCEWYLFVYIKCVIIPFYCQAS